MTVAILAALSLVRIAGLSYSTVDLYVDEAQYWVWSRALAFGYFSKPPLLAWVIAAAEAVCGAGEACIRAPAPLFYLATSLACYAIARELYDERTAFWTALTVATTTGVAFSARIISTDVPLLFFWALALLAYVKLWRKDSLRWAAVLGGALGLGLNAKYAMLFFALGMALAAWVDPAARALLRRPSTWLAGAIATLLIAPNIIWNIANGFVTFAHTADNIRGAGPGFRPGKALEFIAAQFAVFGPVVFGALLVMLARLGSGRVRQEDRLMLMFALPPLALVAALAMGRPAHANWAAPAFVSAAVAATAMLVRERAWGWIGIGVVVGLVAQAALLIGDARAYQIGVPFLAQGDVYARTLGWRGLAAAAGRLAQQSGAATIAGEGRGEVAALAYYLRADRRPVLAWQSGTAPGHHFELTRPLTEAAPEPVLFVSSCASAARLSRHYAAVAPLGSFEVATGPTSARRYFAFVLAGARGPIRALGRC